MFWVISGVLLCIAFAVVVLGAVVLPARRDGREILTERGEEVVVKVRSSTAAVGQRASSSLRTRQAEAD